VVLPGTQPGEKMAHTAWRWIKDTYKKLSNEGE
jgi:hypothetical protein